MSPRRSPSNEKAYQNGRGPAEADDAKANGNPEQDGEQKFGGEDKQPESKPADSGEPADIKAE